MQVNPHGTAARNLPSYRGTLVPMPSATTSVALRPPLKWAGGKRWQVPYVRPLWEPFTDRRLVEPFCGGLAVTLGLRPERALLNDANPHLANFYQHLKAGFRVTATMENDEQLFYQHRQRFNALLRGGRAATSEAAALFYFLNRTGFNGLCRFNRQDEFNVPFGRYERIAYARDFSAYRDAFANWTFTTMDVEALQVEPGDFIYADPPYDVEFTQYAKDRVHVGGSGTDRRLAAQARRPSRPRQPGHRTDSRPVSPARIRAAIPGRPAPNQLYR